jgi:hypothetical protein
MRLLSTRGALIKISGDGTDQVRVEGLSGLDGVILTEITTGETDILGRGVSLEGDRALFVFGKGFKQCSATLLVSSSDCGGGSALKRVQDWFEANRASVQGAGTKGVNVTVFEGEAFKALPTNISFSDHSVELMLKRVEIQMEVLS